MSGNLNLKPLDSSSDLSSKYIEEALKTHFENEEIRVPAFDKTTPTTRDGYLSEIVFLKVKYRASANKPEEIMSLVDKFLPSEDAKAYLMRQLNLHGREVEAYRYLSTPLPQSVCVGLDQKLVVPPLIAGAASEDAVTLIMEDLLARGYQSKAAQGCTLEQTITVFRSIALVHAVGVIDMEKNGRIGSITAFESKELANSFLQPNVALLRDIFKDTPDEQVFLKMGTNSKVLLDMPETFEFIVTLIHCDLWAGNALFDADDKNCAIIDWQFGCLGNLVCDLQTMLFMSCDLNILENCELLRRVLHEYWTSFTAALGKHGVALKKTFKDLEHCVQQSLMYGFMFLVASADSLLDSNSTTKEKIARIIIVLAVLWNLGPL